MFRTLRNLIVNIMAACIRDRDARHKFRNKYKIRSKFRKLQDDNRILFHENKQIQAKLNKIKTDVARLNEKHLFKYKRGLILQCRKFLDIPDLPAKYKILIEGLDDDSIQCVSRILSRMRLISQQDPDAAPPTAWRSIDLYSPNEIEALENLRKEYAQKVIQLSDDCFAYKHYLLPIRHFESSVFYFKHQIPSLKDIGKLRHKDFIDVGGFIGDSALVFTEYTDGKIFSFEAVNKNYEYMLKTIDLNNCKNIVPHKLALGSKDEELEVRVHGSASTMTPDSPVGFRENAIIEKIKVTTLDSFVEKNNVDVGLIKVDIEGYEQEFLKGAEQTIRKLRPTMLLSIYHNSSDFFNIKPIVDSWNLGYTFKIQQPLFGHLWYETLLICECS